jgi:hypothetical protein
LLYDKARSATHATKLLLNVMKEAAKALSHEELNQRMLVDDAMS